MKITRRRAVGWWRSIMVANNRSADVEPVAQFGLFQSSARAHPAQQNVIAQNRHDPIGQAAGSGWRVAIHLFRPL